MHFHDQLDLAGRLSLGTVFLLGAAHVEPSHGKAVLVSYLVGIRGRLRDLLSLVLVITLTHSLVVLTLAALATGVHEHFASEAFLPFLELAAAGLILGLGGWIVVRNLRGDYYCCLVHSHHREHVESAPDSVAVHAHSGGSPAGNIPYLGITGGLVPCQSGIAVALLGASRAKILEALTLTATFSVGMGLALFAIGLAVLLARERASSWFERPEVERWMSWATAALILIMGSVTVVQSLAKIT